MLLHGVLAGGTSLLTAGEGYSIDHPDEAPTLTDGIKQFTSNWSSLSPREKQNILFDAGSSGGASALTALLGRRKHGMGNIAAVQAAEGLLGIAYEPPLRH